MKQKWPLEVFNPGLLQQVFNTPDEQCTDDERAVKTLKKAVDNNDTDIFIAFCQSCSHFDYDQPIRTRNKKTDQGHTALHWAVYWRSQTLAGYLLRAGAGPDVPDKYGFTALHHAAALGDSKMVRVLLDAKAEPNAIDKTGRTAAHYAAEASHADMLEILAGTAGANMEIADDEGRTPLHEAVSVSNMDTNSRADCVAALLQHGVQTDLRDELGRTPLYNAVLYRFNDIIKLLVEYGADPAVASNEGKSALDIQRKRLDKEQSLMDALDRAYVHKRNQDSGVAP